MSTLTHQLLIMAGADKPVPSRVNGTSVDGVPRFFWVGYDNCHFHRPVGYHRYENNCTEHSFAYRLDTYVIGLPRTLQHCLSHELLEE
jgi:hypothetical protein